MLPAQLERLSTSISGRGRNVKLLIIIAERNFGKQDFEGG